MGKRDANAKRLSGFRVSASIDKRNRMDQIIDLCASGQMPNYATAVNMAIRLPDKIKQNNFIKKTDKEYAKLVSKYSGAESV